MLEEVETLDPASPSPDVRCIVLKACWNRHGETIKQRFYDVVASIAETTEGGAIGYAIYAIFADVDSLRGPWGYALVGVVAVSNGAMEVLYRIEPSRRAEYLPVTDNQKKCRSFCSKFEHTILRAHKSFVEHFQDIHLTKSNVVNGIIGGQFIAEFLSEGAPQIIANTLVSAGLIAISIPIQIADSRGKLESTRGKALKTTVHVVQAAFAGLGIGTELIPIIEGFGKEVPLYGEILIWVFFALSLAAANLPDTHDESLVGKIAKGYRSAMYGVAIACFAFVFWLDIQNEITESPRITDLVFGFILAGSLVQGGLSSLVHFFDLEDRHHERAARHPATPPLSQNRHRLELADRATDQDPEVEVVITNPHINPE